MALALGMPPEVASGAAPAGAVVVVPSVAPAPPLLVNVAVRLNPISLLPGGDEYADMQDAEFAAKLEKALDAEKLSIEKQLQTDLLVALLKAGYTARIAAVARRGGTEDVSAPFLRRDQLPVATGAYAIVDVRIRAYGFSRITSLAKFGTYLDLEVRSIDPGTGAARHVRRFVYDRSTQSTGLASDAVRVPVPATSVTFPSRDAIAADPRVAADALRAASHEAAASIAERL